MKKNFDADEARKLSAKKDDTAIKQNLAAVMADIKTATDKKLFYCNTVALDDNIYFLRGLSYTVKVLFYREVAQSLRPAMWVIISWF